MHTLTYLKYLFKNGVKITIQYDDSTKSPESVRLKLNYKLSNIRKTLEDKSLINDTMLFARKNRDNNSLAEIKREGEGKRILKDIIEKKSRTIYLKSRDNENSKQSENIANIDNGSNQSSLVKTAEKKISSETINTDSSLQVKNDDNIESLLAIEKVASETINTDSSLQDNSQVSNDSKIESLLAIEKITSENEVDMVTVQMDDPSSQHDVRHVLVSLDLKYTLSKIRERLEQNTIVKMNEVLSFARKNYDNTLAEVAKEDEEKIKLEEILEKGNKMLYLKYSNEVEITVHIDVQSQKLILVNLNPKDNLSKIRKILERNSEIEMYYMISFLNKTINSNKNSSLAEIAREDEERKYLMEIVDMKDRILYLKCQSNIDIIVQVGNPPSKRALINLNPKNLLSEIRTSLEQNPKVKMNEVLLFAESSNNSLNIIAKENEDEIKLEKIMGKENNILYLKYSSQIDLTIQVDEKNILVNLNPSDNLSKVRKILERNSKVEMDCTLSFLSKVSQISDNNNLFAEIPIEDEEKKALWEILDMKNKILYLKYQEHIDITVQIVDSSSKSNIYDLQKKNYLLVKLNIKENLLKIRECLEQINEIMIDYRWSFLNSKLDTESSFAEISREEENKRILRNIIDNKNKTLYLKQNNVSVTVEVVDNSQSKYVTINLNLKENLSNIRANLERNSEIEMDDTLSFANKINTSNAGDSLSVIPKEHEEKKILEEIIEKGILCLKRTKIDLEFLKNKLKLEYGYSKTLEKASKRAFTVIASEITEIDTNGHNKETIEIDSEEGHIMRKDIRLAADIDLPNFEKLGVSLNIDTRKSRIKKSNVETISSYTVIEYSKKTLKLKKLQPTCEFIKAVKDLIETKDLRKLEKITNGFGQFIPQEIILGGRAYFNESLVAKEDSIEDINKMAAGAGGKLQVTIGKKSGKTSRQSNTSNVAVCPLAAN